MIKSCLDKTDGNIFGKSIILDAVFVRFLHTITYQKPASQNGIYFQVQ